MNYWHGRRILVIDDEAPARWLLALLFRRQGAEVLLASDGPSGLQLARRCEPDLVILDILLPGMDGWQVLRLLRQTSDVPVVVLTAIGNRETEARCLEAGADDHVRKPFERDILLARCHAAVRHYKRLARSPRTGAKRHLPDGEGAINRRGI
ncbi:MAG: response regulator [Chloroflexota bacterium]|jgi:DNA-binding response OmpR family regulator